MFFDTAKIVVKAGNGGDGAVSFHREKYVAAGGPDGGDGGRGGSIVFAVGDAGGTLAPFRYRRKFAANNGENGRGARCAGKDAPDLVITVPAGTLVRDAASGALLLDMTPPCTRAVLLKGGNGGWGNAHFATPTRQVPRFAKAGQKGAEAELLLELKLIADVGLVGFPNVGKSSLLSVVSAARPKIANYHFTTLEPNLGVCERNGYSFVMADIPGLIEGASSGVGLGHDFLRHVERTRMLVHVVDVSGIEGRDPVEDFDKINRELALYSETLAALPQVVAANKCDLDADGAGLAAFRAAMRERGIEVFAISAATREGVDALLDCVAGRLAQLPVSEVFEPEADAQTLFSDVTGGRPFVLRRDPDAAYVVEGPFIDSLVGSVNLADDESFAYFQRQLRQKGVIDALKEAGIQEGDTVRVGDVEFDYVD